jgi:hypothetical protein
MCGCCCRSKDQSLTSVIHITHARQVRTLKRSASAPAASAPGRALATASERIVALIRTSTASGVIRWRSAMQGTRSRVAQQAVGGQAGKGSAYRRDGGLARKLLKSQ